LISKADGVLANDKGQDRYFLTKKPKSGSSSVSYQDAILILRRLRVIIRENVYQDFLEPDLN
jgi:hypothetical protein